MAVNLMGLSGLMGCTFPQAGICDTARAHVLIKENISTPDGPIALKFGVSMVINNSTTFTHFGASHSVNAHANNPRLKTKESCNCTCARARVVTHAPTRKNMQIIRLKMLTKFEQNRLKRSRDMVNWFRKSPLLFRAAKSRVQSRYSVYPDIKNKVISSCQLIKMPLKMHQLTTKQNRVYYYFISERRN